MGQPTENTFDLPGMDLVPQGSPAQTALAVEQMAQIMQQQMLNGQQVLQQAKLNTAQEAYSAASAAKDAAMRLSKSSVEKEAQAFQNAQSVVDSYTGKSGNPFAYLSQLGEAHYKARQEALATRQEIANDAKTMPWEDPVGFLTATLSRPFLERKAETSENAANQIAIDMQQINQATDIAFNVALKSTQVAAQNEVADRVTVAMADAAQKNAVAKMNYLNSGLQAYEGYINSVRGVAETAKAAYGISNSEAHLQLAQQNYALSAQSRYDEHMKFELQYKEMQKELTSEQDLEAAAMKGYAYLGMPTTAISIKQRMKLDKEGALNAARIGYSLSQNETDQPPIAQSVGAAALMLAKKQFINSTGTMAVTAKDLLSFVQEANNDPSLINVKSQKEREEKIESLVNARVKTVLQVQSRNAEAKESFIRVPNIGAVFQGMSPQSTALSNEFIQHLGNIANTTPTAPADTTAMLNYGQQYLQANPKKFEVVAAGIAAFYRENLAQKNTFGGLRTLGIGPSNSYNVNGYDFSDPAAIRNVLLRNKFNTLIQIPGFDSGARPNNATAFGEE